MSRTVVQDRGLHIPILPGFWGWWPSKRAVNRLGEQMQIAVNAGVGCIVERDGKILLIRRKSEHEGGTWSTPGGYLDFGESIESCAAREVLEETSVEIAKIRFRAITNDIFENGKHFVTIWMEANHLSGEAKGSQEASEIGWFSWDQLPQPLFIPFRNLLEGRCLPEGSSYGTVPV